MRWVNRIFMVGWLLCGAAHALYLDQAIRAYRVPDNRIAVDGKADSVWKEIGGRGAYSQMLLSEYGKVVLLPDSIRNDPPQNHYQTPSAGSVTMLAAFDNSFLYFFFIVKENNRFNPAGVCGLPDLWKAHAVDVFVDPSAWSETLYAAYFSADAGEVGYGTSTKTLQVAKPSFPGETREYYRDRTAGNRFEARTPASSLVGVSAARTVADFNTIGVELKVPISQEFGAGKSMFISWGYNHYPEGARTTCDASPIAYRWARHEKSYADSAQKPPGWRAGDNLHYDPLRSRDGWGRLIMETAMVDGSGCIYSGIADTSWDLNEWRLKCGGMATGTFFGPSRKNILLLPSMFGLSVPGLAPYRDIRGRRFPGVSTRSSITPAAVTTRPGGGRLQGN